VKEAEDTPKDALTGGGRGYNEMERKEKYRGENKS